MGGSDGTRAVSEVMGAILVFSLLVTALGAYQVVVVPNQNEQVEFDHNNEVQKDFIDLRNSIHRSATDGEDTSVAVDLGVNYPARALTLNPPEAGGTLQGKTTGPPGGSNPDLAVENTTAVDGEVADYWNGSTKNFTTGKVVYAPSYSLYRNAPRTVVENGLVYNKFDDAENIPLSGQSVVSGREISLVAIESDISRSQVETTAVDVNAVSGTSTKIAVTNASNGDNVTIRIPTNLSEEVWVGQLLADQIDGPVNSGDTCSDIGTATDDDPDQYVHDCTYTTSGSSEFNVLTLEMERNETYTLKLSKVSVGKPMAAPGPHYIVPLEGDDVSVPEQGTQRLVLQVRDRFNNPVSGATVNLSLHPSTQGSLTFGGVKNTTFRNIRADEAGKITATYHAPDEISGSPTPVDVRASFSNDTSASPWSPDTRQNTTLDLKVINASKINRTQPLFNSPSGVIITSSNITKENCNTTGQGSSQYCHINIVFENGASEEREITQMRFAFIDSDEFSQSTPTQGGKLRHISSGTLLELKGDFKPINVQFDASGPGSQKTVEFETCKDDCGNNDDVGLNGGDFLVIEVTIDGSESKTYFFAPPEANN